MIRVLHVVMSLEIGGLERVVIDLIKHRNRYKFYPYICCMTKLGRLGEQFLKEEHMPIFELNKKSGIRIGIALKIRNIIRNNKIDVVHTHNVGAHFYGSIAGFSCGTPVIHTKHGRNISKDIPEVASSRVPEELLSRISAKMTKVMIPVSKDAEKVMIELERIPRDKIRVIENGVDLVHYGVTKSNGELRNEINAGKKDSLCGIVARLCIEKDHETLIRAFQYVTKSHKLSRLVIVGDGPLQKHLSELSHELGISHRVHFLGARNDINMILPQLDLFVLSSITEGIPITLLEAMAAGLPVIATNVGGNPEVVVDGVTGFIIPPKDPEEMGRRILILLEDRNLADSMGKNGRKRIEDLFDIKYAVRKYEEIYEKVIMK